MIDQDPMTRRCTAVSVHCGVACPRSLGRGSCYRARASIWYASSKVLLFMMSLCLRASISQTSDLARCQLSRQARSGRALHNASSRGARQQHERASFRPTYRRRAAGLGLCSNVRRARDSAGPCMTRSVLLPHQHHDGPFREGFGRPFGGYSSCPISIGTQTSSSEVSWSQCKSSSTPAGPISG